MGNTASSSYDVFLSFRGQDTRYSFTASLYRALSDKRFNTFMDDEKLKLGDHIDQSLVNAIQQSRMSIVVLSENYASSAWCLDELVEILKCKRSKNQVVWPIFYKVAPSDVRHQINSYAEAMAKHEKRGVESSKLNEWRSALSEVAGLRGRHYKIGYEYEWKFIEEVVEKVATILIKTSSETRGIVGSEYCAPRHVDLAIVRKVMTLADGFIVRKVMTLADSLSVRDVNDKTIFNLKGSLISLHGRRVLLDATGKPVLTLRRKSIMAHNGWRVFEGDSKELKDLIFSVQGSSMFQRETKLDVFLANNAQEEVCDFKVEGFERSCVIYASDRIAAQMHKKHTAESTVFGKDNFMVTVYPNVDYAFIVALILILDETNQDERQAQTRWNFCLWSADVPAGHV